MKLNTTYTSQTKTNKTQPTFANQIQTKHNQQVIPNVQYNPNNILWNIIVSDLILNISKLTIILNSTYTSKNGQNKIQHQNTRENH